MSNKETDSLVQNTDVPIATAVPVHVTSVQQPPPVQVHSTIAQEYLLNPQIVEDERHGVCRRCRRVFLRPPGVNDGQAQYYRCPDCDKDRLSEIILNSCILS